VSRCSECDIKIRRGVYMKLLRERVQKNASPEYSYYDG
jgi:hypothetical protein